VPVSDCPAAFYDDEAQSFPDFANILPTRRSAFLIRITFG
jgi:hypothetical protein